MDQLPAWLVSAAEALSSFQSADFLIQAVALLLAGALAGVLAGLFGIGGGTMIVPVLYEMFGWLKVAEEVRMPLCIGTSLAVIIPTSISSFSAHWKRGAVDTDILRAWILPIWLGAAIGSLSARFAPVELFKLTFILVALLTATRIILHDRMPSLRTELPRRGAMVGYGLTIGGSSALIGIGGGLIANMVMSLHGRLIHQAVATSAGVGILVSLPATLGYIVAGWDKANLPPLSVGFVSVLGFMLLVPASLMTAKFGVALAHRLSKRHLEIGFAIYLIAVSTRFVVSLFAH